MVFDDRKSSVRLQEKHCAVPCDYSFIKCKLNASKPATCCAPVSGV